MTYRFLFCTYFLEELFSGLFQIIFKCVEAKGILFVLHTCISNFFLYCFFSGSYFSCVLNMSFVFETHRDYDAGCILSYGIKMPVSVQPSLYHKPKNFDATDKLVATDV